MWGWYCDTCDTSCMTLVTHVTPGGGLSVTMMSDLSHVRNEDGIVKE